MPARKRVKSQIYTINEVITNKDNDGEKLVKPYMALDIRGKGHDGKKRCKIAPDGRGKSHDGKKRCNIAPDERSEGLDGKKMCKIVPDERGKGHDGTKVEHTTLCGLSSIMRSLL